MRNGRSSLGRRGESKENDEKMRLRLEEEYREADISNLNSQWAKMEMKHLEKKHGEEE